MAIVRQTIAATEGNLGVDMTINLVGPVLLNRPLK